MFVTGCADCHDYDLCKECVLKVEEIHIKGHVLVMEKEHPVNARRRLGYSRNMCECLTYVLCGGLFGVVNVFVYQEGCARACTHLAREQKCYPSLSEPALLR